MSSQQTSFTLSTQTIAYLTRQPLSKSAAIAHLISEAIANPRFSFRRYVPPIQSGGKQKCSIWLSDEHRAWLKRSPNSSSAEVERLVMLAVEKERRSCWVEWWVLKALM
jgi:hypothetical protein